MECIQNENVSNTDINKLKWRFNHIFLVIANRDFYCMEGIYGWELGVVVEKRKI